MSPAQTGQKQSGPLEPRSMALRLCGDVVLVTHLAVFSIFYVLLSVQEPVGDFVLARILHDGHHALNLET